MAIPMTDLYVQYLGLKEEIDAAIERTIKDSSYVLGKQVGQFEEEIAGYFGTRYAVGVNSGTDALVLALAALGIGWGDEVITTPFTFIATAEAISRVGAKPVFCDIDYETFNIDPQKIEEAITKNTKAILPVHLYGLPCDMNKIMALAKKHSLFVIEDCAQSFGSVYQGQKVGTFGACGCLSFFPAKTLGCYGDGGMVVTNEQKTAEKIKILRNHGSTTKYMYGKHGFNSRLDGIQAAILRVKLKYIDSWIEKRIHNAGIYNRELAGVNDVVTPKITEKDKHTFNYYNLKVKKNRDGLQAHLKAKGIAAAIYYPVCLHLQEVYKELGYQQGAFPVAELIQNESLALPMYPELTEQNIKKSAQVIKEIF